MWHCDSQCSCQWSCFKLQCCSDGGNPPHTHTNTHKDAFIEPIMVMVDTHTQRTWTRKHTHAYYYLKAAISESAAVTEKLSLEAWRVLEDDGSTGSWAEWGSNNKPASFWRVSMYPWKRRQRDPHPRCPRGKMRNKMFWGRQTWEDEGQE